ncbi:MAG TPA: ATP-binding cassette domain-containing protein [Candidatus Eisenbacteria bacterium]|jgi:ABC-2 type transport system ATP-binding protein|nr:ATP-binding cassette domain-containing protein [Candidatus Eisenbacteria bacterium]
MSSVLVAESVRKSYDDFVAVHDVSLEVRRGEIFALLGPNGAGKTTFLRMALDILKPDAGKLEVLGAAPSTELKSRIGYLPEERGLYRKQKVQPVLEYFGQLKGLTRAQARERTTALLARLGLAEWADKKIGELSKGMQQKVQICGAIIGHPELLVLDEPFSGLDPVNTRLLEEVIEDERKSGATVILCTHQIAKVEQFCDRACVLHRGRVVLYGGVDELIRSHSAEAYVVRTRAALGTLPGVASVARETVEENHGSQALPVQRVVLQPGYSANEFLAALGRLSEPVESFSRERLPLEEIFIRVVESSGESVRDLLAESRRAELLAQAKGA